jgi:hypothetical protein
MPQVCLRIDASPSAGWNVAPQTPISFAGPTPAATIPQQIAASMGLSFVNNGVNTVLSNPYYASDAVSQIQSLAEHAGFGWIIDNGTLAITPPGGTSGKTVQVSPLTGMVGYPIFESNQIIIKMMFNSDVNLQDVMQVQSDLTPACGSWVVFKKEVDIEALTPHGKWFMTLYGNPQGPTPES